MFAQFNKREKNKSITVFPCYNPICDVYFLTYVRAAWRAPMIIISLAMMGQFNS